MEECGRVDEQFHLALYSHKGDKMKVSIWNNRGMKINDLSKISAKMNRFRSWLLLKPKLNNF